MKLENSLGKRITNLEQVVSDLNALLCAPKNSGTRNQDARFKFEFPTETYNIKNSIPRLQVSRKKLPLLIKLF